MSQLDRMRLSGNFLDRQDEAARRIDRQGRAAPSTDGQGRTFSGGLLLAITDAEPDAPPPGYVLVFAQLVSDDVYLRAMDAEGAVIELGDWAA